MATPTLSDHVAGKYAALQTNVRDLQRVIVAFSGGVDSSLVAYVAAETLGEGALAVTSGSQSLKRSDLKLAGELAEKWGHASPGHRHRRSLEARVSREPGQPLASTARPRCMTRWRA